ncbi:hypothetical protein N7486_000277 [Penicillium sp. IBT 16267x]|nr:hypothetical protein N7486_000277 [Penicillium sp. IBT 16267x]
MRSHKSYPDENEMQSWEHWNLRTMQGLRTQHPAMKKLEYVQMMFGPFKVFGFPLARNEPSSSGTGHHNNS